MLEFLSTTYAAFDPNKLDVVIAEPGRYPQRNIGNYMFLVLVIFVGLMILMLLISWFRKKKK